MPFWSAASFLQIAQAFVINIVWEGWYADSTSFVDHLAVASQSLAYYGRHRQAPGASKSSMGHRRVKRYRLSGHILHRLSSSSWSIRICCRRRFRQLRTALLTGIAFVSLAGLDVLQRRNQMDIESHHDWIAPADLFMDAKLYTRLIAGRSSTSWFGLPPESWLLSEAKSAQADKRTGTWRARAAGFSIAIQCIGMYCCGDSVARCAVWIIPSIMSLAWATQGILQTSPDELLPSIGQAALGWLYADDAIDDPRHRRLVPDWPGAGAGTAQQSGGGQVHLHYCTSKLCVVCP